MISVSRGSLIAVIAAACVAAGGAVVVSGGGRDVGAPAYTAGGPCSGCSWNGDFSTKGFTQYDDCNAGNVDGTWGGAVSAGYYQIDTQLGGQTAVACGSPDTGAPPLVSAVTPPTGFSWAAGYMLDSGAVKAGEGGERTLDTLFSTNPPSTTGKSAGYQGNDEWYRDMVYFPAGFQAVTGADGEWNWLYELHDFPDGPCCAQIAQDVMNQTFDGGPANGQRLSVRYEGGGSPTNPVSGNCAGNPDCVVTWVRGPVMTTGHWYDIVFHVKWDWQSIASGGAGFIHYYVDGTQYGPSGVGTYYSGPTLYYDADNSNVTGVTPGVGSAYIDHGYYRPTDTDVGFSQPTETVYHAATMVGPTEASIGETFTP